MIGLGPSMTMIGHFTGMAQAFNRPLHNKPISLKKRP